MRRVPMLVAVLAAAAVLFPGAALAAASPTVISGAATSIAQTSVVLQGRVNPDGRATTFFFSYGPLEAALPIISSRNGARVQRPKPNASPASTSASLPRWTR